MTSTDVWIGELSDGPDPLDWGGDWQVGNTPGKRVSPLFPPCPTAARSPFRVVVDGIRTGVWEGKQIDWGAWAATVTKADLKMLLQQLYGSDPGYGALDHLRAKFDALGEAINRLDDIARYVLVAEEF